MELSKGAITVSHIISYFIYYFLFFFFEEDVDSEYMSIYKEDKNKKDGFEHLISLQTVTTDFMLTLNAPPVSKIPDTLMRM